MQQVMKALTIRQPWAWAIVAGHKPFENRSWQTAHRGPLLIHAAKKIIRSEYEDMLRFADEDGFEVPPIGALELGGVVGSVNLVRIVTKANSPWFGGPYGWQLTRPRILPFRPWMGQQGLFNIPV